MVAPTDRAAMEMAIVSLRRVQQDAIRLIRIGNTKDLTRVWASEAVLPELLATGRAEVLGEPAPPTFNADGNLW